MTHSPSSTTPVRPAPDVVARQLPDGAVLVHLGTNQIFELNATGSRIWSLLAEARPPAEIPGILTAEYDVDAVTAEREVAALVARLSAAGLVRP